MFNWTENITVPKITDVINVTNVSDLPANILRLFTYAWVWFLGGWFFAGVIGAFGAALYIKHDNAMVPVVFFIVMLIFLGPVLRATPLASSLPSAEIFVYIIGLICGFAIGFLLYQLFVSTRE